ncbi:MAG: voltage-gated potassium channel [Oleispira sp.]|jgi:voltage-gated potassium channel
MILSILKKTYRRALFKLYDHAWITLLITISFSYLFGLLGMMAFGETDIIDNYSWFFVVTITTVGYGDFAPSSPEGRFIAGFIMASGIGAVAIIIGKLSELIISLAHKKNKGLGIMNTENHTLLMGYRKGSTEKVITELLVNNPDEKIILCSEEQETNPLNNSEIVFIRGELASEDVLTRSNAHKAKSVIVYGRDDNQTFISAFAFRDINQSAHMVCYLNNEDHYNKIIKLPADDIALNQVILPVNVYLMAQELQDRESSNVIQQLISNLNGENLYRFDIDKASQFSSDFKHVFFNMKLQYDAMALAIKESEVIVNPSLATQIRPGMAIFYTASTRIENINLDILGAEYE